MDLPVEKVMLPVDDCPSVSTGDTIDTVLNRFAEVLTEGHAALIVRDDNGGKPVGLLEVRTVLELLEPDQIVTGAWTLPIVWEGYLAARRRQVATLTVRDIAPPLAEATAVTGGDSVVRALHLMLKHRLETLPVLQEEQLAGVLRQADLILHLQELDRS